MVTESTRAFWRDIQVRDEYFAGVSGSRQGTEIEWNELRTDNEKYRNGSKWKSEEAGGKFWNKL